MLPRMMPGRVASYLRSLSRDGGATRTRGSTGQAVAGLAVFRSELQRIGRIQVFGAAHDDAILRALPSPSDVQSKVDVDAGRQHEIDPTGQNVRDERVGIGDVAQGDAV